MKSILTLSIFLFSLNSFAVCEKKEERVLEAISAFRKLNNNLDNFSIRSQKKISGTYITYKVITEEFYATTYIVAIQDNDFCEVMKIEVSGQSE